VAKYDRLLELVFDHCTIEQIKEALRPAIGNKNVKLSADNKEDLVFKNVKQALDSHSLDVERLYEVLREAEENGPQHIFYLRCPSKDVTQLLTPDYARNALLGMNAPLEPVLSPKINGQVISEVRPWGKAKPSDWVMKIYGHETREVATGEIIRESATRILHVFAPEEYRYVLMARWNAPDLLEIRVPRDSSTQRIENLKRIVERTVGAAVPLDRFSPWSLKKINKKLFDEKEKHGLIYRLGDAELEDEDHNRIRFQSHIPDADLFGGAATESAAKGLLEHNSTYNHQRVIWLKLPVSGLDIEISTLIGARSDNEVIFSRHQNSRGIDYVTRQLRSFSKG
jgi:hypothetical protein